MTIETFLLTELFAFLIIFVRIGSGVMVMPGIGETYVSARIRLLFALAVALLLTPMLQDQLPPPPGSPLRLMVIIAGEVTIGLFLGLLSRIILSAMHTLGMIISYQSSLAAATMFDISQAGQGSAIGNFLSVTAVVLFFSTDLHHSMLAALVDSYTLFVPGAMLMLGDMANTMSQLVSEVFLIALKLSTPVVAVALMVNLGAGILARLMPNMQVFFVLIPAQVQIAMLFMMTTLSGVFLWYLDFAEAQLGKFLGN